MSSKGLALKNDVFLFTILRASGYALNFLLVPLFVNRVGKEAYGIWLTLLSFTTWLSVSDLGLANGLRNELSSRRAADDCAGERELIASYFGFVGAIVLVLSVASFVLSRILDWTAILNASNSYGNQVRVSILIVLIYASLNMALGGVKAIFYSHRMAVLTVIAGPATNGAMVLLLLLAPQNWRIGIWPFAAILVGMAVISAGVSLYFFFRTHRNLLPRIADVSFAVFGSIGRLGGKFFVLQLTGIVVTATDRIIITRLFGPEDVAIYGIVQKYFSIIILAHAMIIAPFWSAFSEALGRDDTVWIRRRFGDLLKLLPMVVVASGVLTVLAPLAFRLWIGPSFVSPTPLVIFMGTFVIVTIWNSTFWNLANGIGLLDRQIVGSILGAVVNIPLCIFLAKYCHLGLSGITLAMTVSLLFNCILVPVDVVQFFAKRGFRVFGRAPR